MQVRPSHVLTVIALLSTRCEAQDVTIDIASPASGQTVQPGTSILWSIVVADMAPSSLGMAAFAVDLTASSSNPAPIFLSSSAAPSTMSSFERPGGICNPLPSGAGSAYGGTPLANGNGGVDLLEIGGAQNAFGASVGGIGLDVNIDTGVAKESGGRVVATGIFAAPSTAGQYCLDLVNPVVGVLLVAAPAGSVSTVASLDAIAISSLCFNVAAGPACDPLDFNQDSLFPDTLDIADFLSVFGGGLCDGQTLPPPCNDDIDFNNDGLFPDTQDIASLLSVFAGGPCI